MSRVIYCPHCKGEVTVNFYKCQEGDRKRPISFHCSFCGEIITLFGRNYTIVGGDQLKKSVLYQVILINSSCNAIQLRAS